MLSISPPTTTIGCYQCYHLKFVACTRCNQSILPDQCSLLETLVMNVWTDFSLRIHLQASLGFFPSDFLLTWSDSTLTRSWCRANRTSGSRLSDSAGAPGMTVDRRFAHDATLPDAFASGRVGSWRRNLDSSDRCRIA